LGAFAGGAGGAEGDGGVGGEATLAVFAALRYPDLVASREDIGPFCRLWKHSPLRVLLRPMSTRSQEGEDADDISGHPDWPPLLGQHDPRASEAMAKHKGVNMGGSIQNTPEYILQSG
jgi:hypothetical protein